MHSLIIMATTSKSSRAVGLESLYANGLPSYADYTDDLGRGKLANVADALCDIFPFCTKDGKNATALHIDNEAAYKALLDRYAKARDLCDQLADGKIDGLEYEVKILTSGDTYGVHVVVDNYDMNDFEFIRYCAEELPDTLYIKRAWDYHC